MGGLGHFFFPFDPAFSASLGNLISPTWSLGAQVTAVGQAGPGNPTAESWLGCMVGKAAWRKGQMKDLGVALKGLRVPESIGARSCL